MRRGKVASKPPRLIFEYKKRKHHSFDLVPSFLLFRMSRPRRVGRARKPMTDPTTTSRLMKTRTNPAARSPARATAPTLSPQKTRNPRGEAEAGGPPGVEGAGAQRGGQRAKAEERKVKH